jgi:hypothetical protein
MKEKPGMPDDPRAPLNARWRRAMARLGDSLESSPELEARVKASLGKRPAAVIRGPSRRAWVAVAALVVVAGALIWLPPGAPAADSPRYLFLLYEGNRFDRGGATHQQLVGEYAVWAGSLAERGKLVEASELGEEEHLLSGAGESTRAAAGTISGFFIVRAADMTEAAAIAATCPHLKYGGEIAVRPLREE